MCFLVCRVKPLFVLAHSRRQ